MAVPNKEPILFSEGWEVIEPGIVKILRILEGLPEPPFTSEEHITIYTTIHNMCVQKDPHDHSELLYKKYREVIEEYITSVVLPSLKDKHDEFLLRELAKRWLNHKIMTTWFLHFFVYLNRYFVKRKLLPSLDEVAVTCFRDLVYQETKGEVKDAVISLIDRERQGEQIDRALLKNVIDIFVEIGMGGMDYYKNDFEDEMLKETAAYYSRKASNLILIESFPDYMLKIEECVRRETNRIVHYLHATSKPKLVKQVCHEIISVYSSQFLENEKSGCPVLIQEHKVDHLSRMYRLFSNIDDGLLTISQIYKKHVTAEGTALVKEADAAASTKTAEKKDVDGLQDQTFIREVIDLHDKNMQLVNDGFQNHTFFHKALKEAFEIFLNKTVAGSSTVELLVNYCDNILKKGGSEKLNDEAIEEKLEKAVNLLGYIFDKDLFAAFYRKKLARRLIFDNSANKDHEKSILTKLKLRNGAYFTLRMEGMVTDMTLAGETQANFEEYLQRNPHTNPGIDLTVTILTTGFWPSYQSSAFNLPYEMIKCTQAFKEFYQTQQNNKKLKWIYSLGTCNITANFESKTMELTVTTYQAAVLLLFNDSDRLSYSEIKSQLKLTNEGAVRLLQSLCCSKYKILNKEPNTKSISSNDVFEFNSKFTNNMRRIEIPLPLVDEKRKIVDHADKNRKYAIDACLVRIMKSHRVLDHRQLIMECVQQLNRIFKPNLKLIKKRIEDLISRDYLKRDSENLNLYRYVA